MPKFLFEGEFKALSNDARVLYSLLKDRHELSLKNNWIDEKGNVFLIFSRDDMQDMLGLSKPTVIKAVNCLKKHGLIEEERLGQGKANRIYLTVATVDITERSNSFTSESKESLPQKVKNFNPNDTNISNTDLNNTIFLSPEKTEQKNSLDDHQEKERKKINNLHQYDEFKAIIHQCHYNQFEDKDAIEQAIRLLYYSTKPLQIGSMLIPPEQVREDLKKLEWKHIDFAIRDFKIQSEQQEIKYPVGYLSRCIYNAIFQGDLKMKAELKYHGLI